MKNEKAGNKGRGKDGGKDVFQSFERCKKDNRRKNTREKTEFRLRNQNNKEVKEKMNGLKRGRNVCERHKRGNRKKR